MQFGSVREVNAQHVHNGQRIALEGFTHLIPFAAGHDVIAPPSADELRVLRDLHGRTKTAHAGSVLSSPRKFPSATMANQD